MRRTAIIDGQEQIRPAFMGAYEAVKRCIAGGMEEVVLEIRSVSKTRDQERHYHAIINEIAKQHLFHGRNLGAESWKRLLVNAFKWDTKDDPDLRDEWGHFGEMQLMPALNNPGFVAVGEQTRKFSKKLAIAFLEWLLAYCAENNITTKGASD